MTMRDFKNQCLGVIGSHLGLLTITWFGSPPDASNFAIMTVIALTGWIIASLCARATVG